MHDGEPATTARLQYLQDLTLDPRGRLLLAAGSRTQVLRLEDDGTLGVLTGDRTDTPATIGGPARANSVRGVNAIDVLPDGRLLVAQYIPGRILAVLPGETAPALGRFAGDGQRADVGYGTDHLRLAYPTSVARAPGGSTHLTDYLNSQVRQVTNAGLLITVAGTGVPGFSGDSSVTPRVQLDRPRSVVVDPTGAVLIADTVNNRVRRIDPTTRIITTIVGTGIWGSIGDGGPATAAQLAGPHGLALGPDGALWIADTGNSRIRRVDPVTRRITTVAGTTAGSSGDGGPALAAQLTSPRALAVDGTLLYVSDPGTRSVRRVDLTTGRISRLTGPATGRPLHNPASLLPTPGGLLVAEAGANKVLRLDRATGAATTIAGTGSTEPRGPGDVPSGTPGLASSVALSQPQGLAPGPGGSVIIADTGHHRLLRLLP